MVNLIGLTQNFYKFILMVNLMPKNFWELILMEIN